MTKIDECAEAIWTYEISVEKVLKRLVDKNIFTQEQEDEYSDIMFFILLTDIAREMDNKSPEYLVPCWVRSYNVVEYLRLWESFGQPQLPSHQRCGQVRLRQFS